MLNSVLIPKYEGACRHLRLQPGEWAFSVIVKTDCCRWIVYSSTHDGLDVEHQLPPLASLQPEAELLAGPLLGAAVQRHGAALVLLPAVQQRRHVNGPEIVLYWSGVNRNLNNIK